MKRPVTQVATGALLALALLAGCGGNPAPAQQGTATGGKSGPKAITIVQGLFPETMDPHLTTVQATHNVSTQIFEPLVMLDFDRNEQVGVLATGWKQLDPKTWQFNLREGVKFTNGEEFTADTVKFNFERIMRPEFKSPVLGELRVISGAQVVSKNVINITTKEPAPTLLLGLSRMYLVPEKYTKEVGDAGLAKNAVGTGPFKLKEFKQDEKVVLVANSEYWGGKPKLDEVTFKGITEASTRLAALKAGEADLVTDVNIVDVPGLKQDSKLDVLTVPSMRAMYLILDATKGGPIADKRVRLALNYAVDKQAIIKNLLQGYGEELQGQWLTKGYFGFNPNLHPYGYDPQKAKDLLQQAGLTPSQISLDFYSPQGRYMMDKEVAEAVAGQLQNFGVKVNLKTVEWATFIKDFVAKKMTPAIFIGMSTPADANYLLGLHVTGNVYSYYANPQFDQDMKDAGANMDQTKRLEIYKHATEMMFTDPPGIALYQQVNIYGAAKRVKGWKGRPDERIVLTGVDVQ